MPYSYRSLIDTLAASGIEEPAAEAALLLERVAGVSYSALLSDRDRVYDSSALEVAVTRRLSREPLQYILGSWEFFGCTFSVNEHCLIPRPDTEVLVETAIDRLPPNARFADLCTGSGCIAVATLKKRPDTTAVALELDQTTLDLARKNAESNGVSDRLIPIEADLLKNGVAQLACHAPFDAILSNPPYIRSAEIPLLSAEVQHEPRIALDGGEDGLLFYRAILRDYPSLLRPGGHLILEIGCDQGDDLRALAAEYLPTADLCLQKDLGGRERVVILTLPA